MNRYCRYQRSATINVAELQQAAPSAGSSAAAAINVLRMPDMSFDFRFATPPNMQNAATVTRLLCVWATAGASPESLQLEQPHSLTQRLLHFLISDNSTNHRVCSSPLNSSDVDHLFHGTNCTSSHLCGTYDFHVHSLLLNAEQCSPFNHIRPKPFFAFNHPS